MENIEALAEILKKYNEAYRKGKPLVSDHPHITLFFFQ